ncbi:MAG: polyphosphate polymerase domain-containing protein [Hydrogenophaga sp.]|jgi:hypothetical protein|nr:polyphosphate polymerase domain-containing protein [Hydrogenophaga sp.]
MNGIDALLHRFPSISLRDLNARAGLMTRRDNKYLLSEAQLATLLQAMRDDFEVLEIGGLRQFRYTSIYLDTDDLHCFRDHNQSRRHRLKLRFRHYLESQESYFELKVKDRFDRTRKYRYPVDPARLAQPELTPELRDFLIRKLSEHAVRLADRPYQHRIEVGYQRSTLVHRHETVRITLDNHLRFAGPSGQYRAAEGLWIAEIKSEHGRSSVDRLMLQQGIRPVPRCSKYCVGLSLTDTVNRVSRFTPTVNRIRRMGEPPSQPEAQA